MLPADHTAPHSTSPRPDALEEEDIDQIWGEADDAPNREWSKMDEDFTNAGYREGITAGKEAALQEGFDDGFARVGAPLGREIGVLRGAANAAMGVLSLRTSGTSGTDPEVLARRRSELVGVIGGLGRIRLEDLAPPDVQAQEHAREHQQLDSGAPSSGIAVSSEANARDALDSVREQAKSSVDEQVVTKPAVEELNRLRIRLSGILQEIGLDIPLV